MAVAPYRPRGIERLDMAIASIANKCCNLPISTPNAVIHVAVEDAYMPITSLMVDYIEITTATLTRGLNATGSLGATTKALLKHQCENLGYQPRDSISLETIRYRTVARQYHLIKTANIRTYQGGKQLTPKGNRGLTNLNQLYYGPPTPHALRPTQTTQHQRSQTTACQIWNPHDHHH